jgi:molybdenum cofactor biosynthesis protein A
MTISSTYICRMHNELETSSTSENTSANNLTDSFNREHTYLRISLIEKCNLRCTYCMPAEGVGLSPPDSIMSANEVLEIAKTFVNSGVTKIRLTGGEPLLRKDFELIYKGLDELPAEIGITTNAVLLDKYLPLFKEKGMKSINISLDTLNKKKFFDVTRRDQFDRVMKNIYASLNAGIQPRINVVLLQDFNENEINDFIELTKDLPLVIRFIEFMPFEGNEWKTEKLVPMASILQKVAEHFDGNKIERIQDKPNDTSKNYRIKGFVGNFSIISTVTNPFCDSCNRIRLTANGTIKNCLFSEDEVNILKVFRKNEPIMPVVKIALGNKHRMRGGMDTLEEFSDPKKNQANRSMILIGG